MGFESFPHKAPVPELNRETVDPELAPWERIARLTRNRSRMIDEDVIMRIQQKNPNFNFERLKPEIERLEHGNLDIHFVGVSHTVETLAAHRKVIEAAIAEADMVVLEAAINTSGAAVTSGHIRERTFPVYGTTKNTVVQMPEYKIDANSGIAFFSETENMARTHGKQIVVFDPATDQRFLQSAAARLQGGISQRDRLEQLNQRILRYSELVSTIGGVVGYGALAGGTAEIALHEATKHIMDKGGASSEEKAQTRREFIKRGMAYTAGMGLGIGMTETAEKNKKVISYKLDSDSEQGKAIQYNEFDFRDVSVATGLDRLSKTFSKKMKVAVIYGADHESGIREYLENPRLRQTKLALYKPFRDIAPPEMTAYKYEFDPGIASGERRPEDVPESEWGYWKQTVQAPLY